VETFDDAVIEIEDRVRLATIGTLQHAKAVLAQHPAARLVEQQRSRLAYCRRTIRPGAKMDSPARVVSQIQLEKRRMVAARKRRLGTAFLFQLCQGEFDVLADAQFIGRVVRAGAKIVARIQPANRHAVAALRLRITDAEIREEWFSPKTFQTKRLLAPKLPPQRALPINW